MISSKIVEEEPWLLMGHVLYYVMYVICRFLISGPWSLEGQELSQKVNKYKYAASAQQRK
jgi:hypothetical protein